MSIPEYFISFYFGNNNKKTAQRLATEISYVCFARAFASDLFQKGIAGSYDFVKGKNATSVEIKQ